MRAIQKYQKGLRKPFLAETLPIIKVYFHGEGHWRMEECYESGTPVMSFLKVIVPAAGSGKLQNNIRQSVHAA